MLPFPEGGSDREKAPQRATTLGSPTLEPAIAVVQSERGTAYVTAMRRAPDAGTTTCIRPERTRRPFTVTR
jgi:hypothetical protein